MSNRPLKNNDDNWMADHLPHVFEIALQKHSEISHKFIVIAEM